jgi:hypothetical protein
VPAHEPCLVKAKLECDFNEKEDKEEEKEDKRRRRR